METVASCLGGMTTYRSLHIFINMNGDQVCR